MPRLPELQETIRSFWAIYYAALRRDHEGKGLRLTEPVHDRKKATTNSAHVSQLEDYWQRALARRLSVSPDLVGKRKLRFNEYASKSFDVCWPLDDRPKILISVKSMQNATRNFTNRIEEAFGDAAVLRHYGHTDAAFGFFFFFLDGGVSRGIAEPGEKIKGRADPQLALVEEGGDFFDTSRLQQYAKKKRGKGRGRQDCVEKAEKRLLDLLAEEPQPRGDTHYDAIAFAPTTLRHLPAGSWDSPEGWRVQLSPVDERLSHQTFLDELVTVAEFRGLL